MTRDTEHTHRRPRQQTTRRRTVQRRKPVKKPLLSPRAKERLKTFGIFAAKGAYLLLTLFAVLVRIVANNSLTLKAAMQEETKERTSGTGIGVTAFDAAHTAAQEDKQRHILDYVRKNKKPRR